MRENCRVTLVRDKEIYTKEGVYKGMDGIICCEQRVPGMWLVSFDYDGEKYLEEDIACIPVYEEDLVLTYDPRAAKENSDNLMMYSSKYKDKGIYIGTRGRSISKVDENDMIWMIFEDEFGNEMPPMLVEEEYISIAVERKEGGYRG